MGIDLIRQTLFDVISDLGIVGWMVLGVYVSIFGLNVILRIREFNIKRRNRNRRQREKEIRRLKSDISYNRRMSFYEARTNYYNRRSVLFSGSRYKGYKGRRW